MYRVRSSGRSPPHTVAHAQPPCRASVASATGQSFARPTLHPKLYPPASRASPGPSLTSARAPRALPLVSQAALQAEGPHVGRLQHLADARGKAVALLREAVASQARPVCCLRRALCRRALHQFLRPLVGGTSAAISGPTALADLTSRWPAHVARRRRRCLSLRRRRRRRRRPGTTV